MIYNRFNREISCHHVTVSLHHHITASLCQSTFALPPATKPVGHLPCPLPPNQLVICLAPYHRVTASPCHRITTSPHHHVTMSTHHCITMSPHHCITGQSFALPPATKPVSHLPCPLPPNQSVICLAPYHCVTTSPHHRITVSPCHCLRFSPPHGYESDWLMLTSTVLIG